jgi:hypothetical protein
MVALVGLDIATVPGQVSACLHMVSHVCLCVFRKLMLGSLTSGTQDLPT